MKMNDFIKILDDCCNDVSFSYNGKMCGIVPEVLNYQKTYHVWYGEKTKDYDSTEKIIADKFFDGKSLKEIYNEIEITVE